MGNEPAWLAPEQAGLALAHAAQFGATMRVYREMRALQGAQEDSAAELS